MTHASALVRACGGPILLMTLGGLTALDTFGVYSLVRTWPMLLIMLGLLKLAEKAADSRGSDIPPPQSGPYSGGPTPTGYPPASGAYSTPTYNPPTHVEPVHPADPPIPGEGR